MKKRRSRWLLLGLVFLLVWRAWPGIESETELNVRSSTGFSQLPSMCPPASALVVGHRGLPHPGWEPLSFWSQLLFLPRRIEHGHAFQRSQEDAAWVSKIAEILASPEAYREWLGSKACGGFHADHYLRWTRDSEEWEVIVCLGCHEAMLFHGGESLRCDLSREAGKALEAIETGSAGQQP